MQILLKKSKFFSTCSRFKSHLIQNKLCSLVLWLTIVGEMQHYLQERLCSFHPLFSLSHFWGLTILADRFAKLHLRNCADYFKINPASSLHHGQPSTRLQSIHRPSDWLFHRLAFFHSIQSEGIPNSSFIIPLWRYKIIHKSCGHSL